MVLAGRICPKTSPCTAPTASASAASTTYWRVRTTSSGRPPSSARAARAISQQRRVWVVTSGSTLPSGQIGAVPLTATVVPTRTARLKPIVCSYGDPEAAWVRVMGPRIGVRRARRISPGG